MTIEICAGTSREWERSGTKPVCPVCLRGPRELNVPRPVRRLGIYEGTVPAHADRPAPMDSKDKEIERLQWQVATLVDKVSQLRSSNAALMVDGDRREQRALALLPDCDAHRRELQYLRHCVSWYWDNAQTAEEARQAIVAGLLVTARRLRPDVTFTGAELAGMLEKAVDRQKGPLKRKGYPTLADCIRAGGCDHDGLSDAVKADIAEALGLAVTEDA